MGCRIGRVQGLSPILLVKEGLGLPLFVEAMLLQLDSCNAISQGGFKICSNYMIVRIMVGRITLFQLYLSQTSRMGS